MNASPSTASKRVNLLWLVLFFAALLWLFLFYALEYKYHFYYQEQTQIFLYAPDWLNTYFDHPGWLALLIGDWLTQFYYYIGIGPLILTLVMALTAVATYFAFKGYVPGWLAITLAIMVYLWLVFSSFAASCRLSTLLVVTGWMCLFWATKPLRWWALLFLPLGWWCFGTTSWPVPSMPQWEYEERLAISNEYYFGNYDRAAQLAQNTDRPNKVTSFYYYLSQAQQGTLADSLLRYPIKDLGTLTKINDKSSLPVINMMNELYYLLGDMTYAERAAMMNNVFSRSNRNVRMIKRLAEINLVSEDTVAAMKYLRVLSKTHAYSKWAAEHTPGKMTPQAEAEILAKRAMVNKQDTVRVGDNCYVILDELLKSNPNNMVALDYMLCTDLLLKDMETFKRDYDRYCMDRGKPRLKPIYQQALMIYLTGTNAPQEEWEKYIKDFDLMQRFMQYNQLRGSRAFADTYWYYFDTH
ncbi:MAG: DUF6057 family protein [Bacteroidales bacterium]|nr:DUF6057 family protein [Bacteroidales bacterium]